MKSTIQNLKSKIKNRIILLSSLILGLAGICRAQQTNLALFQEVAVACLAAAPDTARAFRLDAPAQMPYLRTALVARWQTEARTVFLSDSATTVSLPRLGYAIEEVKVDYRRARGKRIDRAVTLALRYTLTAPDGRLLREERCRDTRADTIHRNDLAQVESTPFPETQASPPEAGWRRRYLEPVVITGATAIGVFLFFSLRSNRTNDG